MPGEAYARHSVVSLQGVKEPRVVADASKRYDSRGTGSGCDADEQRCSNAAKTGQRRPGGLRHYNKSMFRCTMAVLIATAALPLLGQDSNPQKQNPPANAPKLERGRQPEKTSDQTAAPPEEDTTIGATTYSFNPLQAKKDIEVGNEYAKKHNYRAAANRYLSATKYNDGDAEAWLKLGETEEKLKDRDAARDAYQKYLGVASDAKNASEIRKRMDKLK